MHPIISQAIDRFVIWFACVRMDAPGRFEPHLEEARQLLQQPDFFEAGAATPDLELDGKSNFQFPSAVSGSFPQTNTVYGKLHCGDEDWRARPAAILVHGWNDEVGYRLRNPLVIPEFHRAGVSVATIQLPYHLRRRPPRATAVDDFLSEDLLCTIRAAQQAVADTRGLLRWLKAQGCPRVGIWGISLGGWLTGLVACHEPLLDSAVMTVPAARMDRVIEELPFCAAARSVSHEGTFDFERLNLRSHRLRIPPERLLIVEAVDDLFARAEYIEEFWRAWNKPEIWRVRDGHITALMSPARLNRMVAWLGNKLTAPA